MLAATDGNRGASRDTQSQSKAQHSSPSLGYGAERGIGYTNADRVAGHLIRDKLTDVIFGRDAMAIPDVWIAMMHAVRSLGRPGIASMAIAAVDAALWDLKAKLLSAPVVVLLGACRPGVPIYGSGGFTSYTIAQLQNQMSDWARAGIRRVKMKIGREPEKDVERHL